MPQKEIYVLIFLIIVWLLLSILATIRIIKTNAFNSNLKILMVWLIPLFWALFVLIFTSKAKKSKIDKRNKYREAGYKSYTRYR